VFTERTSVGLDVHARSVAAAAINGVTGELFQSKLTSSHHHIRSWLADLPGQVADCGGSGAKWRRQASCRSWSATESRPTPRTPSSWLGTGSPSCCFDRPSSTTTARRGRAGTTPGRLRRQRLANLLIQAKFDSDYGMVP
jgi:hypothetical protein